MRFTKYIFIVSLIIFALFFTCKGDGSANSFEIGSMNWNEIEKYSCLFGTSTAFGPNLYQNNNRAYEKEPIIFQSRWDRNEAAIKINKKIIVLKRSEDPERRCVGSKLRKKRGVWEPDKGDQITTFYSADGILVCAQETAIKSEHSEGGTWHILKLKLNIMKGGEKIFNSLFGWCE